MDREAWRAMVHRLQRVGHDWSDLAHMQHICTAKETISKVKIQPSEWEKMIANETTDKRINSQNIESAHIGQYQKNKQPNQKVGKRPKQRWLTNTWKDAQRRSLLEKCKSKLQWDITSHWSEWPSWKCRQTINAGEGVEKREPSRTVGDNINW